MKGPRVLLTLVALVRHGVLGGVSGDRACASLGQLEHLEEILEFFIVKSLL